MSEQQLDKAISALAPDIVPERDLWAGIEPQLAERSPKAKPVLWHWATAAMLGLACLVSWQLALLPGTSGSTQASMPTAELMLLQVYETQKANQLSQTVAIAEGFDNWQQQLQVWDQAIAQVRHALQFYPDEPQLLAQLQSLYQQQLAYIQRATLQQPLAMS